MTLYLWKFGLGCALAGSGLTILLLAWCRGLADQRDRYPRRVAEWEGWRNMSAERIREFAAAHRRKA